MQISGCVQDVRFCNEDNGFSILVMDIDGNTVVVSGTFPPVTAGESLSLTGDFVTHPKFGRQFKATNATRIAPSDTDSIFRFISSGIIKGLGLKTASLITGRFGADTLNVLEKSPSKIASIRGISLAKATAFSKEYKKHLKSQDAIMFLQGKGLSINMALKIYKKYGTDTVAVISLNPYKLIEDIEGIGFLTADRIAAACGVEKTSEFRISAGIICALKESGEQSGNTFLFRHELLDSAKKLLNVDDEILLGSAINSLIIAGTIRVVKLNGGEGIFLRGAYVSESGAAQRLVGLLNSFLSVEISDSQIEKEIGIFSQLSQIELNEQQKSAVIAGMKSGISVITGGPGTGKTTIIKCLLHMFSQAGQTFTLMAPTGRAAKRINESTGEEASTIHRALKLPVAGVAPNQLTTDNIIVDEVSMMDIYLFNSLLKSVRDGTRLILLGDKDQLPSVGAGNVLGDLLSVLPCTVLTQIYRQSEQSLIIKNAHMINSGQMPVLTDKGRDFFFMKRDTADGIAATICDLIENRLPSFLGIDAGKIQVLCPMKNGGAGTKALNDMLSAALNKSGGAGLECGGWTFRAGDKVMQITNNYTQAWTRGGEQGEGVFNGDMGVIEAVFLGAREVHVLFEDGRRAVYSESIDELILAYAITVHKSQGSEFEAVVMPILPGSPAILTRNLLYTAVTRAKRLVVLVGLEYGIKRMVENDYIALRNSALTHFIVDAKANYQKLFGTS